jgi:hypothetical protein
MMIMMLIGEAIVQSFLTGEAIVQSLLTGEAISASLMVTSSLSLRPHSPIMSFPNLDAGSIVEHWAQGSEELARNIIIAPHQSFVSCKLFATLRPVLND